MEWPPKAIMECQGVDDANSMKEWIQSVQSWIETESPRPYHDDSVQYERAAFDKIM